MIVLQAGGGDIIAREEGWVAGWLAGAVVEARRAVRLSSPGWRGEGDFVLHDVYSYSRNMRLIRLVCDEVRSVIDTGRQSLASFGVARVGWGL